MKEPNGIKALIMRYVLYPLFQKEMVYMHRIVFRQGFDAGRKEGIREGSGMKALVEKLSAKADLNKNTSKIKDNFFNGTLLEN